jgi:hypothetical protein
MKKSSFFTYQLIALLSSLFLYSNLLFAEGVESTQISGKEKDLLTDEALSNLSPGDACEWNIKSGCVEPRLLCVGVADFANETNPSIRIAYKIANTNARLEMVKTFQNAKNVEKCTNQLSVYTNTNAGEKNSGQIGDFCRNTFTTNSEAYLIGVTTLASEINRDEKTVKVMMGRDCKGAKAGQNFLKQSSGDFGSEEKQNPKRVEKYRSKEY